MAEDVGAGALAGFPGSLNDQDEDVAGGGVGAGDPGGAGRAAPAPKDHDGAGGIGGGTGGGAACSSSLPNDQAGGCPDAGAGVSEGLNFQSPDPERSGEEGAGSLGGSSGAMKMVVVSDSIGREAAALGAGGAGSIAGLGASGTLGFDPAFSLLE